MGVCILAKRVVLELSSSTNFVYSLKADFCRLFLSYPLVFYRLIIISGIFLPFLS